ncbi:hypothetical protein A0H81_02638 [Grifola frondosa]|uniref:Uncharacterized protein n=1 Tax=Grifola frondosa TaxID=5627 RepID=A0A1C7MKX8_GRIFR|nr:hypothetical protein A0H81_02638 [Grifola frondosa]
MLRAAPGHSSRIDEEVVAPGAKAPGPSDSSTAGAMRRAGCGAPYLPQTERRRPQTRFYCPVCIFGAIGRRVRGAPTSWNRARTTARLARSRILLVRGYYASAVRSKVIHGARLS